MNNGGLKRSSKDIETDAIQTGNNKWWTDHTMSYDWKDKVEIERFTSEWFDEVDRRFVHGARLFAHNEQPFDKIIPFKDLKGKRVLEIGCGMGYHSELIARAGAELISIDISETSISATQKRFECRGLSGMVKQMDAVNLEFPDEYFDFVWSWGVIHHSAQTATIIKEISRVLKPGGETRIMVYNLSGTPAYVIMLQEYITGFWRGENLDDCLWKRTDGFMARYYSSDMLCDVMRVFFVSVSTVTFGQDADAVPLPRKLRLPILKLMSDKRIAELANKRGGFLFATATK